MVEAVVRLMTQLAGGTAAALGTGSGQEVSVMVRERLGGSERGRLALQAVDERPEDAEAVGELRSLIQSEVDTDPDFARRIAAAMPPPRPTEPPVAMPPPRPTEPPVAMPDGIRTEGATIRGHHTISLGPVSFKNTRNNRLSLVAAALVFVGLVVLGVYGGARLVTHHAPEQRNAVTALSPEMLRGVLPDTASMPAKWTQPEPPGPAGSSTGGFVAGSGVDFLMGEPDATLSLTVLGYDTAQKASSIWHQTIEQRDPKGELDNSGMKVKMPDIADEMWAAAGPAADETPAGGVVIMRVGTVVILINGYDSDNVAFATHRMEAIATLMADRAHQAQNGEKPTASVRDL